MSRPPMLRGDRYLPQPASPNSNEENNDSFGKLEECGPPSRRSSTPDQTGRASFSSVRENNSDLAQTFTSSKVSSYSRQREEEAIDDLPSPPSKALETQTTFVPPITRPHSRLFGQWFPSVATEDFKGWKQIGFRGREASKSSGDLQALRSSWESPGERTIAHQKQQQTNNTVFEGLPNEIFELIAEQLVLDIPPEGHSARNVDLMSLLLTCKTLHASTLRVLYRNITMPHSRIFKKFLARVAENRELGTLVRRLDFSHFNPTTLFLTANQRAATQNLTPQTLLQCLEMMPFLKEFLGQEYIDDELDAGVLQKLFMGFPNLHAIDLTGCSSALFRDTMSSAVSWNWPQSLTISRLSLHRCNNLTSELFEVLLPRLGRLTHLDVAGTNITDRALQSIPQTARLTHLNLAKCKMLTAQAVINFLSNHPAVQDSLIYLSLATDARSHMLLDVDEVTQVLQVLPKTLRSLSLKGSNMEPLHVDLLLPLTKHLEELALGRGLGVHDVDKLFAPKRSHFSDGDGADDVVQSVWEPHTLRYLDLSDYFALELDLGTMFGNSSVIMTNQSAPLQVVEITDDLYKRLQKSPVVPRAGWKVTDFGSRAWLVRCCSEQNAKDGGQPRDSGFRSWKMGASYWGMRKIPAACAEVGGMYGSYMFKRKL